MSDVGETVFRERQLALRLGILEHLHPDDDERPLDPSASSWETPIVLEAAPSEVDIDREADMPPPAPLAGEASPNSSERKEITNW